MAQNAADFLNSPPAPGGGPPSASAFLDGPPDHVAAPRSSIGGMLGSAARGAGPIASGAMLGAAAGAPFAGVGAIPGAIAGAGAAGLTEAALDLYNPIAKAFGLRLAATPQEATDKLFDMMGVPRPTTEPERVTEAVTGGTAQALSGAGAARTAAGMLTGTGKAVAEQLAAKPVAQALSGALGGGAAQGAAEAGAGPVGQTIAGLAGSALPGVVGKPAGHVIAPKVSADAQELLDAGVELTPGQLAGRIPKRAEEAAKSVPITGSMIRAAEGRAIDTFNLATANKALDPIGVVIPKGTAGRDIIANGQRELSQAYDSLLSQMQFRADRGFATDVQNLVRMVQTLPVERQQQFARLYQTLMERLAPTGTMLGENLKIAQSELTQFAKVYKRSPLAGEQQLGQAVDALNDAIHEGLRRQNPAQASRLDDIDRSYAMFVRVERAANQSAVSGGRFTPGSLLTAIKTEEPSIRKRGFARGDALLQDWAQKAYDVIGNKMPDSGTPERMMWDVAGGGVGLLNPKLGLAIGGSIAPYTPLGASAVRNYAQPGAARNAVGQALRQPSVMSLPMLMNPGAFVTSPFPPSPIANAISQ